MIGKALKNVRSAVTKAAKPAPRKPFMSDAIRAGGFGVGFGGGAGMAPAKRSPMGSIKNAVGQAVAAKKASNATNRLGKSMLGSMMKKGGAVKKTAAKKGKK